MSNQKEVWKAVLGYEGTYEVSNLGRIKSLYGKRSVKKEEKIKKENLNTRGYKRVSLSKNKTQKMKFTHILVAQAFVPNPENKPCVNHIDGNNQNNCADNLEWVTQSENVKHAFSMNLSKSGVNRTQSKFTREEIYAIRNEYIAFDAEHSYNAIAKKYNTSPSVIYNIVKFRTYRSELYRCETKCKEDSKYFNTRKLTNDEVIQLRNEYIPNSQNNSQRALAKKYNISQATIWSILNNKTYKNI